MIELGKKDEIFGKDLLKPLGFAQLQTHNRPIVFPMLESGHRVIAGYDQGLGERMIVCEGSMTCSDSMTPMRVAARCGSTGTKGQILASSR